MAGNSNTETSQLVQAPNGILGDSKKEAVNDLLRNLTAIRPAQNGNAKSSNLPDANAPLDNDTFISHQREAILNTVNDMRNEVHPPRHANPDPHLDALERDAVEKFSFLKDSVGIPSTNVLFQDTVVNESEHIMSDHLDSPLDYPLEQEPHHETPSVIESEPPRIQAFAKLEFDDGQFYMNTYAVELGRDVRAARVAMARDMEASQNGSAPNEQISSGGNASQNANRVKPCGSGAVRSMVSEKAGIMGVDPEPKRRKKRKDKTSNDKSKSTDSSSQFQSRRPEAPAPAWRDYQASATYDRPHPVHPESLLPSPDEVPLIPIHPPSDRDEPSVAFRGISRKHVRIGFNFDKHVFEVEVKGRNGAFVDDHFYGAGTVKVLRSGSYLQIGGVSLRFWLPDTAEGETGAEESGPDPDGSQSSFESGAEVDFENGTVSMRRGSNEDDVHQSVEDVLGAGKGKGKGKSKDKQPVPLPPQSDPTALIPPKKRGPGRPPKDGISSKREKAEQARAAKLAAKKEANGGLTPPPSGKAKVSSVSKNESTESKPEKRKYSKRKNAEDTPANGEEEELEPAGSPQPKPKDIVAKRERSPSPDYGKESEYTPEQLAKPKDSYQILVYDILSECGKLDLKGIYRALKKRYRYFVFKADTVGWQSSVRHNLNQCSVFCKVEKSGKGWLWGITPGVPPPHDRKRRVSPPQPLPAPPTQQFQAQSSHPIRHPVSSGPSSIPHPAPSQPLPQMTNGYVPPIPGSVPAIANPAATSYTSPYQSPYGPPSVPQRPSDQLLAQNMPNYQPPGAGPSQRQADLPIQDSTSYPSLPTPSLPPVTSQPDMEPIWRTATGIPESVMTGLKYFVGRIWNQQAGTIINLAVDRALGFRKIEDHLADPVENHIRDIIAPLLPGWGWEPGMANASRGVKRAREEDDEDGSANGVADQGRGHRMENDDEKYVNKDGKPEQENGETAQVVDSEKKT